MSSASFFSLLKLAVDGDLVSQHALLQAFAAKTITADEAEQLHLFLKRDAHHQAVYLRGLLYSYGYGVPKDEEMAFLLMREAAAKGSGHAMYEVGHRFLYGMGVAQNYISALQWLKLAATSPHYNRDAMLDLARMYQQGLGTEMDVEQYQYWSSEAEK